MNTDHLLQDETFVIGNVVWILPVIDPVQNYEPTIEEYEGYIGRVWMNAKKPSTQHKALDWLEHAQNTLLPEDYYFQG